MSLKNYISKILRTRMIVISDKINLTLRSVTLKHQQLNVHLCDFKINFDAG